MVKKEIIIIADYTQQSYLTLDELCEACRTSADHINDLVEHHIVTPQGRNPHEWQFKVDELDRIKRALRIGHDLEVNVQGVALVLELLEEMEKMRAHILLLEKYFSKR